MPEVVSQIVVTVPGDLAEIVIDRMWQWGVQGVSQTMPDTGPVTISTSVGNDPDAIARALATLDPSWSVDVTEVVNELTQVAREHLRPTWYAPDCVSVPAAIHPIDFSDDDLLITVIDPGSAFGLGDHPTTRTSMALLEGHFRQDEAFSGPRESLLDVGCGSGVLAVLAAQLGVETIRAIDIADAAVEATQRNMELNDVAGRIEVDTTDVADLEGIYDIVMANILAPTLISMADDLQRLMSPRGSLFISGILADRHQHVLDALAPLAMVESLQMGEWITIKLQDVGPIR